MPKLRWNICLIFFLYTGLIDAGPRLATAKSATQNATLTGYTRARTILDLSAETEGKVETVFADIGEHIADNGQFACLDKTFISLDIEANATEISRTNIDIDYFSKQVTRYKKLLSNHSSSQLQLDDFERSQATARQQLRTLKIRSRELAERKRRYCIAAPANWTVIKRYIEPGEWLKAGDRVAQIGNFSRLLVPFALSMSEYESLMKHAQDIRLTLPDLQKSVPAIIERVSPAFDEQSRKIVLDLEIQDLMKQGRGGIRADLSIQIPNQANAVLLPESAVIERYEQYWLERPNGEQISVVYLGRIKREGQQSFIRLSGTAIKPGDQFIVHTSTDASDK